MLKIQLQSLRFKRSVRYARIATALVLALSFLMILPHSVSVANITTDPASGSEKAPDKKVKSFKGAAVKNHIDKLRVKNKGLARAMKEYAKKGLTPKWEDSLSAVQVSETSAAGKAMGLFQQVSYVPQQEDYYEGDSEITFITYGGDLNYWDGIVYVHTAYQDDTYSGDLLTPTDDGTNWDVANEVYYPPDGSTPCDGSRACMMDQQVSKATPGNKQKADRKAASLTNHSASPIRPGLWGWLKNWWNCVVWSCAIGYYNCNGSFRALCRVAICVYSMFRCL
jgi:hypothetical protein